MSRFLLFVIVARIKKLEIIQNKKNILLLFSLREAIKIAKKSDFFLLSFINWLDLKTVFYYHTIHKAWQHEQS